MQTGQKIAQLRTQAGMSQEELAEKLYVSRHLISKWETGKRRPDYKSVLAIADIFGTDADSIIDRNAVLFEELSGIIPDELSADAALLSDHLNTFLLSLNDRDRRIFVRRYYYMEDTAEISQNYSIKESYVRTVLMRTRKKLTKYFKEAEHEKK